MNSLTVNSYLKQKPYLRDYLSNPEMLCTIEPYLTDKQLREFFSDIDTLQELNNYTIASTRLSPPLYYRLWGRSLLLKIAANLVFRILGVKK